MVFKRTESVSSMGHARSTAVSSIGSNRKNSDCRPGAKIGLTVLSRIHTARSTAQLRRRFFAALIAPVSIFAARHCTALLYYAFCVIAAVDLHVFDYSVSTQCSAVLRRTARSVNAPLDSGYSSSKKLDWHSPTGNEEKEWVSDRLHGLHVGS